MRRIVCLIAGAGLAWAQSGEKRISPVDGNTIQSFDRQPKIALLIGVGAYPEGSGLSPLKYPARDVADLAAALEKQGYAVRQLTDAQASRGVVVRTLNQIGQALDPDRGTLLFYFSGHGFAEKGMNYLATYGVSADDLERDGLSLGEVERLVKGSRAKRQVLWVDACRNDPGSGARDVSRRSFAQLNAAEGMRVLYSTRAGSVSYEDDSLQHGVFTHFLLRGLQGEAAGPDGLVTFQDLAGYVSESVMAYGVKSGRIQRPFDAGEASGDFLLAKSVAPPVSPPLRAGVFRVNAKDGLTYTWIPPGTFMMGCSPGDRECNDNEKPARQVTIAKGFWMGQTEVTHRAYNRLMGQYTPFDDDAAMAGSKRKEPDRDSGRASLRLANGFCQAAGGRLPAEAQWEYAARAGTTGARYGELAKIATYLDGRGSGLKVAEKAPNSWGLYDMLGNVAEWTAEGVIRGGGFMSVEKDVRVSWRANPANNLLSNELTGFRCVLETLP